MSNTIFPAGKAFSIGALPIYFFHFAACFLFLACGGGSTTPLDAGTRQVIDSIAAAEIRQARLEIDSLCQLERTTTLPHLVDSIKQKRIREIQEQLKTVPK